MVCMKQLQAIILYVHFPLSAILPPAALSWSTGPGKAEILTPTSVQLP